MIAGMIELKTDSQEHAVLDLLLLLDFGFGVGC